MTPRAFASAVPRLAFGAGTAWYSGADANAHGRPLNAALVASQRQALEAGIVHVDAAEIYGTEQEQGQAIREFLAASNGRVRREDLFVTTKVYPHITDIRGAVKASLARLGLAYLDLYLIHAPWIADHGYKGTLADAWREMEALVDAGLVRYIGVSNFLEPHLDEVLAACRIAPVVNQIEYNPYLQQRDLLAYCKQRDIMIACYAPLSSLMRATGGPVDAVVDEIAARHGKTPAQVLLKWSLAKDHIVVTTTSNAERMAEYVGATAADFVLSGDEIARIDDEGTKKHYRHFWTRKFA